MPDFTYPELDNPLDPGGVAGFINGARNAFCDFSSQNPWILSGTGRWIRDRMCPPPSPPLPDLDNPTVGGQCCQGYNVVVFVTFTDSTGSTTSRNDLGILPGRLQVVSETTPTGDGIYDRKIVVKTGLDCPNATPAEIFVAGGQALGSTGVNIELASYQLVPENGGADDCGGNPFPDYPLPPERPLPPLQFDFDIDVGGVNVSIPVTIPIIQTDIDVDIRPEITLELPDVTFNFDLGGVNITVPIGGRNPGEPPYRFPNLPDINFPPEQPPNTRPPTTPRLPPGQPPGQPRPCPDVNLTPVLNAIARVQSDIDDIQVQLDLLLDCDRCNRVDPNRAQRTLIGTGQSGKFQLAKDFDWVLLIITTAPSNARIQWGVEAPDVYYAGWYAFGNGEADGDRNPIHYRNNIFPVVESATNFSFTLQSGYNCEVYGLFKAEED